MTGWIRAMAIYAAITLAIIAVGVWLLGYAFPGPAARRALLISGGIAFVVQLPAFAMARYTSGTNPFAGWGAGVLLRFVTLAVFALLFVERLGLPSAPALVSLALFLFASTLVEPLLLTP